MSEENKLWKLLDGAFIDEKLLEIIKEQADRALTYAFTDGRKDAMRQVSRALEGIVKL